MKCFNEMVKLSKEISNNFVCYYLAHKRNKVVVLRGWEYIYKCVELPVNTHFCPICPLVLLNRLFSFLFVDDSLFADRGGD